MTEWHGWGRKDGPTLHISPLPERKSVYLSIDYGAVVKALARFSSEDDARTAMRELDRIILGDGPDDAIA